MERATTRLCHYPIRKMIKPTTYSDAGVDIDAATRATDKIKELAEARKSGKISEEEYEKKVSELA